LGRRKGGRMSEREGEEIVQGTEEEEEEEK
jgi:hypothetical protein